jgi:ribosome recycling factor
MSFDDKDLRRRMSGAVNSLKDEFVGLRTGRASTALLDTLKVDAYGSKMPINQVASLSVPEARLILIQVWDQSMVNSIEKSIRESDLGLNPHTEGSAIRIPIPELSEERRVELFKVAGKYSEQARVSIRNVRRDIIESIRKQEKDSAISEDEKRDSENKIQNITDGYINEIDDMLSQKEQDIKSV